MSQVQVSPYGATLFNDAVYDANKEAYIIRLDPQDDASAIAKAFAADSNNYVRIGHLTRPDKKPQGSMTDEQYEDYLVQYEAERAAFNAKAVDYTVNDPGIVWDGITDGNGGWSQSNNQSMRLPLIDTDGGFTMVKIQVGIANNYSAADDAPLAERIGTVKTYNLLIGQKYTNNDAD